MAGIRIDLYGATEEEDGGSIGQIDAALAERPSIPSPAGWNGEAKVRSLPGREQRCMSLGSSYQFRELYPGCESGMQEIAFRPTSPDR